MKKFVAIAVLGVVLGSIGFAQTGPPKILQIGREEVKAGKGFAHAKYEASWTQAMLKAKYNRPYLGMTSMNGNEAWWLTGFDSLADLEKENNDAALGAVSAQFIPGDAEYISNTRTVIARYREDLSYGIAPLGGARGFNIRTVRVRPGHDSEYADIRKLVAAAVAKANDTSAHSVVFQVVAGAPNGTYLVFTPFTSLAERDAPPNEAVGAALGEDGRAKITDLAGKSILTSEDTIFTFNPKFSNPSPEMVSAAPDFWKPKVSMAKAAPDTAKKPAMAAKPANDKTKAKAGQ